MYARETLGSLCFHLTVAKFEYLRNRSGIDLTFQVILSRNSRVPIKELTYVSH
jgi:hypothetical protein